jgi:hypothetical protein
MHPYRHIIVPFFTVLHWSVTAALTARVPAAHPRDFHAVKRQIRNADYAPAAPPSPMSTSDSVAHSHPTTTTTDDPPASHPSDSVKGNHKDSRSLDFQPQPNNSSSGFLSSNRARSSGKLAPMSGKPYTEISGWKGSPPTLGHSESRSRRHALADASPKLSEGKKLKQEPAPKSQASPHDSNIVVFARELAAKQSTTPSLPSQIPGLPVENRHDVRHTPLEGENFVEHTHHSRDINAIGLEQACTTFEVS